MAGASFSMSTCPDAQLLECLLVGKRVSWQLHLGWPYPCLWGGVIFTLLPTSLSSPDVSSVCQ